MRWYLLLTFIIILPCLALTGCKDSAAKEKPLVAQIPPAGGKVNPIDGAAMVLIPEGEFLMGRSEAEVAEYLKKTQPDVKPSAVESVTAQRKVMLDSFYIYQYEVTVAQYRKFCKERDMPMPKEPPTENFIRPWKWQDDNPIVGVSWYDALAYCDWAGAKLPTEAQWEKAARGNQGNIHPWGNNDSNNVANRYNSVSVWGHYGTWPVGYFPMDKSPYNVFDMAGNVREWCEDWYDKDYYKEAQDTNPLGPEKGKLRTIRGGSWLYFTSVSCAMRDRRTPTGKYFDIGFRCVMKVDQGL